jgi:hypothetical protein
MRTYRTLIYFIINFCFLIAQGLLLRQVCSSHLHVMRPFLVSQTFQIGYRLRHLSLIAWAFVFDIIMFNS